MAVHLLFLHLQACERTITFAATTPDLTSGQTPKFWALLEQMSDHLKSIKACKVTSYFNVPSEQSIKGPLIRLPKALDTLMNNYPQLKEYTVVYQCVVSLRDVYITPPPALLQSEYITADDARREAQEALVRLKDVYKLKTEPYETEYYLLHKRHRHVKRTYTLTSI